MGFDDTLAAAKAGDEAAFSDLWQALNPPLVRYLRVLAPQAADDVASECWLQVVRSLRGFKGDETGFRSWLFTIARNKLRDLQRRQRRRPTTSLEEPMVAEIIADDDTECAVLDRMGTDAALRLIGELPEDQAEILMLRVVAGLEVADVARIVRKSPGAVRVASHRALARLRDTLNRSGERADSTRNAVTP